MTKGSILAVTIQVPARLHADTLVAHLKAHLPHRRLDALVSGRIREEFQNGRHYYALEGQALAEPQQGFTPVTHERLLYHAEQVYCA